MDELIYKLSVNNDISIAAWVAKPNSGSIHMMRECVMYTECVEVAAVSHDTSQVTTKQHCNYTTLVDIVKNMLYKVTVTLSESQATRAQWVCSRAENRCAMCSSWSSPSDVCVLLGVVPVNCVFFLELSKWCVCSWSWPNELCVLLGVVPVNSVFFLELS